MGMYDFKTDITNFRLQRLEGAVPYLIGDGSFAANRYATLSSLSTDAVTNGLIDLSNSSGLITVGAIPPSVSESGFAATFTDTTVTWYWDGTNSSTVLVIRRTDGTRQTIPGGSITITGLTASTWYGFLPFWSPANGCNIGWVQGTAGTPQIAFPGGTGASFVNAATKSAQSDALAQQLLQGREQLSAGIMTIKTAAGGGSGSGGATGGGSACIMRGTHVATLQDLPYSSKLYPQNEWWQLVTRRGKSLYCTPNHSLYHPERGRVRADSLTDWVVTDFGEEKIEVSEPHIRCCVKEQVLMPEGHLYYANGFLSHNMKAPPE
jgi:hypothetical protein